MMGGWVGQLARTDAQARECVSTRIWWVVGGLNCGLNFSIKVSETHPLGKDYNPVAVHVQLYSNRSSMLIRVARIETNTKTKTQKHGLLQ